jgi:hypothetical protein
MAPRLKRIGIGVVIGLGLMAGGLWLSIQTLGEREPLYQGKPIWHWITQLESRDLAISNQACVVVQTEIIPQLVRCMFTDTNDSPIRVSLIEQLNGLPGVKIFFTPADGRRTQAAHSLGELGVQAKGAIPDLLKAIKGKDLPLRPAAARALGQIHSEPETLIPMLVGLLDDPQDDVPEAAADALGRFGPLSKVAIPKLIELSKVQDKDLHHAVTQALKKIDPEEASKAGVQ